ncbi:MAG TPA: hypothetical protein VG651_13010 [Stellaceae bacterium]|nr:hypothetical protein [Stellaceae bacterium]
MHSRSLPWRTALFAGLAAAFLAGSARAADTGNGSKNFRVPSNVPNYFSNEAGPMLGGAAESRRGELYMRQTYAIPRALQTAPAEAPRPRQHMAMAEPRGRLVRTHGARVVAHHVTVHGRHVTRVAAHGSTRSHSAHVGARPHTVHAGHSTRRAVKATRVGSSRRHVKG